jgi:hypothetical protein
MPKPVPDSTGSNTHADVAKLRLAIDEIDEKIMDLINRRLMLAKQIGDVKKQVGIRIWTSCAKKKSSTTCCKKTMVLWTMRACDIFSRPSLRKAAKYKKRIENQND